MSQSSLDFNFNIVKQAGFTQEEFAKALGVSRVTVNSWCRGRGTPHVLIAHKVAGTLAEMRHGVNGQRLPLPQSTSKVVRERTLSALVRRAR